MEKIKQYCYTTDMGEVHKNTISSFTKYFGELKDFVSATWIENFASKGKLYTVITKDSIYDTMSGPEIIIKKSAIASVNSAYQIVLTLNNGKKFTVGKTVSFPPEIRTKIVSDISL
jgi:uncharacterized protein YlzI (FlbEa/FlbD family)